RNQPTSSPLTPPRSSDLPSFKPLLFLPLTGFCPARGPAMYRRLISTGHGLIYCARAGLYKMTINKPCDNLLERYLLFFRVFKRKDRKSTRLNSSHVKITY